MYNLTLPLHPKTNTTAIDITGFSYQSRLCNGRMSSLVPKNVVFIFTNIQKAEWPAQMIEKGSHEQ